MQKKGEWEWQELSERVWEFKKDCENGVQGAVREFEINIANNVKKNLKMVYSFMNTIKG